MDRVAQCTFERIARQAPVHHHVTDDGLDGAAPLDHCLERSGDAAPLPRAQDAHALDPYPTAALVHNGRGRRLVGASENAHLGLAFLGQVRSISLQSVKPASHISGRLIVCGGAIIDFLAGKVPRAPLWVRNVGMEWLFRLGLEPHRLFKRYVVGDPLFVARALWLALSAGD